MQMPNVEILSKEYREIFESVLNLILLERECLETFDFQKLPNIHEEKEKAFSTYRQILKSYSAVIETNKRDILNKSAEYIIYKTKENVNILSIDSELLGSLFKNLRMAYEPARVSYAPYRKISPINATVTSRSL